MATLQYSQVKPAVAQSDLTTIAPYLFWLMFRNIASDGFVFEDSAEHRCPVPARLRPLASPFLGEHRHERGKQDYCLQLDPRRRHHRDRAGGRPLGLPTTGPLDSTTSSSPRTSPERGQRHRSLRSRVIPAIDGTPRSWTDQSDGPALQTLAILQLFAQLDAPTQATASTVIAANLNFLGRTAYHCGQTYNLWEEEYGASFFARSGPAAVLPARSPPTPPQHRASRPRLEHRHPVWLQNALASHWNGQYYQSMLPVPTDYRASFTTLNIDIVMERPSTAPSRSPTPSSWPPPPSCAASGPTSELAVRLPGPTAPTSNAASAPCSDATPGTWYDGDTDVLASRRSPPGRSPRPTSPSSTTGSAQKIHFWRNGSV